jgi:hypothetical protein
MLPTVFYNADNCYGMRGICGNGGRAAWRYAMPPVYLPGEAGGGVRGLSPVRSPRPTFGKMHPELE